MSADPIPPLFAEWQRLYAAANAGTDGESNRLYPRRHALELRIVATPAPTLAGIIAKARLLRVQMGRWVHEEELAHSIIADLERLAKGGAA